MASPYLEHVTANKYRQKAHPDRQQTVYEH